MLGFLAKKQTELAFQDPRCDRNRNAFVHEVIMSPPGWTYGSSCDVRPSALRKYNSSDRSHVRPLFLLLLQQ